MADKIKEFLNNKIVQKILKILFAVCGALLIYSGLTTANLTETLKGVELSVGSLSTIISIFMIKDDKK